MPTNIPACGIDAYKRGQVYLHLPPNRWWLLRQRIRNAPRWWVPAVIAVVAVIMVLDFRRGTTLFADHNSFLIADAFLDGVCIAGFGMAILWMGLSFLERQPGEWRRYSRKGFAETYGGRFKPLVEVEMAVENIRKTDPMAEFELDVLERPSPNPHMPEYFGVILVQVMNGAGKIGREFEGRPVIVVNHQGRHEQFGEDYVPYAGFLPT